MHTVVRLADLGRTQRWVHEWPTPGMNTNIGYLTSFKSKLVNFTCGEATLSNDAKNNIGHQQKTKTLYDTGKVLYVFQFPQLPFIFKFQLLHSKIAVIKSGAQWKGHLIDVPNEPENGEGGVEEPKRIRQLPNAVKAFMEPEGVNPTTWMHRVSAVDVFRKMNNLAILMDGADIRRGRRVPQALRTQLLAWEGYAEVANFL